MITLNVVQIIWVHHPQNVVWTITLRVGKAAVMIINVKWKSAICHQRAVEEALPIIPVAQCIKVAPAVAVAVVVAMMIVQHHIVIGAWMTLGMSCFCVSLSLCIIIICN